MIVLNAQIRPNAILALSLHHCGFSSEQARRVLQLAMVVSPLVSVVLIK